MFSTPLSQGDARRQDVVIYMIDIYQDMVYLRQPRRPVKAHN